MGFGLPNEVLQGLGLAPPPLPPPPLPPVDDSLAGALPAQPQIDTTPLPALPAPVQPSPPTPHGDFVVPAQTFGHPGALGQGEFKPPVPTPASPQPVQPAQPKPAQPQRPAAPMTPDQQYARAQQKQSQADVDAVDAVAAKRDAEVAKARDELAASQEYDRRAAEVEQQRKAFQEESAKVRAQKQAYVDATLKDVDSYRVDQNKYVKDMGLGGMAGWGIAMIMSNIGAALQNRGGDNTVLQMLQNRMHQAVVAQVDERDRLKERNARATHELDKYDAFSKNKMDQINLLDAQNEKRLANMLRSAAAKSAEPTAQANALKAAADLEQSSAEKAQKAANDAAQYDMQKKQLSVSQGNLAVSRANAIETQRHNLATEGNAEEMRILESAKLVAKGKDDQAKLVRERAIGGETKLVPVDPKNVQPGDKTITKDGKTYRVDMGLITTRNGDIFVPNGTETTISKFQENHEYGQKVLSKLDEIRRLGPEWLSDTANSAKAQQLKTEVKQLLLDAVKFHGLGVITGHDTEHTLGAYGLGANPDATGWKDVIAGLDKARENVVRDMGIAMQQRGLDKAWEGPPDPAKLKNETSRVQELETALRSKVTGNPEKDREVAYGRELKASGGNIAKAHVAGEEAFQNAKSGRINLAQADAVAELAKIAKEGGDRGAAAIASLEAVVADREKEFEKRHKAERPKAIGFGEWQQQTIDQDLLWRIASAALTEVKPPPPAPITSAGPAYDPTGYDPDVLIRRFSGSQPEHDVRPDDSTAMIRRFYEHQPPVTFPVTR